MPGPIAGAIIGAVVGGVVSNVVAGVTAPDAPSYGTSTWQGYQTEAMLLPARRRIEQMARLGQEGWVEFPMQNPNWNPFDPDSPNEIMQRFHVDFRGMGDADVNSKIAQQMAAGVLELQQIYGPQFVEQSKKMQELADPEGTAAYRMLYDEIMRDLAEGPTTPRPVATELDQQMQQNLSLGRQLTPEARTAAEGVAASRGEAGGTDALVNAMETGTQGERRQLERQQALMGYLQSGVSPEETAYRRRQQSLGNIGAFLNQQTPVAQFGQLSSAQQGASPMPFGPNLPGFNQGNVNTYNQMALSNYGIQSSQAANSANNWLAGIGLVMRGAGMGISAMG